MKTIQEIQAFGGHDVIYADPPWSYNDSSCYGAAAGQYKTMSDGDIGSLPINQISAKDSVLFLWATYPKLPEALDLIKAWGFTYKSIAFQWVKLYKNGTPFFGLGRWTRGNTEPVFLAVKGKPHRDSASVSQLVTSLEDPVLSSQIGRHKSERESKN